MVLVGAPSADVAERIAAAVVPEHLAAAVNILPGARSIFFWQGRVEHASEALMMIKTRADRLPALERRVRISTRTRSRGSSRSRSPPVTRRTWPGSPIR